MARDSIVVLGAGVVGLQVATVLAERGYGKHITMVAAHLPGDTSISYTSPWAGANFSAISGSDINALRWDRSGYSRLMRLASTNSRVSFVQKTTSTEYWDEMPVKAKIDSMAAYLEDFRILPASELPEGVSFGIKFTTITLNAPEHIKYLLRRLQNESGVQVRRQKVAELQSAFLSEDTRIVFNCIGNAARDLPGVQDSKCFPTRGQILLARAPQVMTNVMRHGKDYETYIIPQPYSNGKVILGGFMQKHIWTGNTFGDESDDIWNRTSTLLPSLNADETEVVAAFSGLRPSREGGARVEREVMSNGRLVVHNYGAGGTGFQAGYGMATAAVDLADAELAVIPSLQQARL